MILCSDCHYVATYADDSSWDELDYETLSIREAALSDVSFLDVTPVSLGYFDCYVCDEVSLGDAYEYTPEI